ncbi:MAG: aldo/keto reductase [Pseudomonadota bacterium]
MQKRRLGRDGPLTSAVGIGAMSFTDFYGATTKEESLHILSAALDLGIDHIDTANVYGMGRSEDVIGEFLRGHKGECPFVIATKASITRNKETKERVFDNSRAHLEAELDISLKRMGLEKVDLFYVHRRDQSLPIEEVTESLASFVKAGKIGGFGFSEIAPYSLRRAAAVHPVGAVQSEYSLSVRTPEVGLTQACAEVGAAVVAFSPVGRGLLTDRPPSAEKAAGIDFLKNNPRFFGENLAANLLEVKKFQDLAADLGTTAASLSIAWLLHQGDHVLPIPGTRSVAHLKELAAGAGLNLSAEDLARIDQALPIGWAHGDRYNAAQWVGPERYA